MTDLIEKCKETRKYNGLSQRDTAELLGVSRSSYVTWEEHRGAPNDKNRKRLREFIESFDKPSAQDQQHSASPAPAKTVTQQSFTPPARKSAVLKISESEAYSDIGVHDFAKETPESFPQLLRPESEGRNTPFLVRLVRPTGGGRGVSSWRVVGWSRKENEWCGVSDAIATHWVALPGEDKL